MFRLEAFRNPHAQDYPLYGARGIKCFLTTEDIREMWERDRASEMKRPSIDRINPKGNYVRENCRFLELSENARRARNGKEAHADRD